MRTKSLLLAAALSVAGALSGSAQSTNVYSQNAVGYVQVTIDPDAFKLVANPFNTTNNTIQTLLPDAPVNTVAYYYDVGTSSFVPFTKRSSGLWTGLNVATTLLNPGTGFFLKNPDTVNPLTLTFVGDVPQGAALTVNILNGFALIANQTPIAGRAEADLLIPAVVNDVIYRYVNGNYQTSTRRSSGAWTGIVPGDPTISVAEGFFYQSTADRTWIKSFSVNN